MIQIMGKTISDYVLGIMKSPLPPGLDIIPHTESMVLLKRLEACLDICLQPAASEKDTIADYKLRIRDYEATTSPRS